MFQIGDKEFSDKEVSDAMKEEFKKQKEECHNLTVEHVDSHPRRKLYALYYKVDTGVEKMYADFTDEEVEKIKQLYREVEELEKVEPFKNEEERWDYISDCFDELDVDFYSRIPEFDMHWGGGTPDIIRVDLEDWRV